MVAVWQEIIYIYIYIQANKKEKKIIMYDTYLGLYHYTRKDCFKFFSVITINIQLKIVL